MNKLLSVKSLVTLSMTAALIGLLFTGTTTNETVLNAFCTAYGAVIAYFFTRKEDEKSETVQATGDKE